MLSLVLKVDRFYKLPVGQAPGLDEAWKTLRILRPLSDMVGDDPGETVPGVMRHVN